MFWHTLLKMVVRLFPSETAKRVRTGNGVGEAFQDTASNPFRREWDILELSLLLDEVKIEHERLRQTVADAKAKE